MAPIVASLTAQQALTAAWNRASGWLTAAVGAGVPEEADRNRDTDPGSVRAFCFVGISN